MYNPRNPKPSPNYFTTGQDPDTPVHIVQASLEIDPFIEHSRNKIVIIPRGEDKTMGL